ncbi:MAG TPA: PQQ-binding-like beta-propeller repeat protein [Planctomycetota bacterium]
MIRKNLTLALSATLLIACAAVASDWPTFRGDAQRSGASDEQIAFPLALAWTHKPIHAPTPAWPEAAKMNYAPKLPYEIQNAMTFDHAYHVVADAESIYYGSSTDDAVYALNAATGEVRWSFVTEGPVRLTPVLSVGKVYAGSDDGFVYCLDARTGSLVWKSRAGEERRLLGNGRMISLWPIRGGLVIDSGTLYFTAGIFPDHGVYLCALDATTGKKIYKKALEFSVQGNMLAGADRVLLPTGRTSYRGCKKDGGDPFGVYGVNDPWKKNLVGGTSAMIFDDTLAVGPSEAAQIHWFRLADRKLIVQDVADCVLAKESMVYTLSKGQLKAYTRAGYFPEKKAEKTPEKPVAKSAEEAAAKKSDADVIAAKPPAPPAPKWNVATGGAETMIMAHGTILTAGKGEVAAYDAQDGKKLWAEKVDGNVEGLALSHGRLLASLESGAIVCFQKGAPSPLTPLPRGGEGDRSARLSSPQADAANTNVPPYAEAAEAAVKAASAKQGYCLVLQGVSGQLALEIAKRSDLQVICRIKDAAKAEAARNALMKTGLYGSRIVVHQGDSDDLPYPKYFANLIVCEGTLTGSAGLPSADQVLKMLRPCGGAVDIAAQAGSEASGKLKSWGEKLPQWSVKDGPVVRGTARRGALAGAGEWSHFYADPANTACSNDEIRPGKMDIQWFGRPGPADAVDRHKKGPAPLFKNGRVFVSGFNHFAAVDAYNGTMLWERNVVDSARIAAFKDSSNMAASDERLFVASGASCLVLDAQTGQTQKEIALPNATPEDAWGYLAVVGNTLVGSAAKSGGSLRAMGKAEDTIIWRSNQPVVCSTAVFGADPSAGKVKWSYAAKAGLVINATLTIGNGRVFFIESRNASTLESKTGRATLADLLGSGAQLVALELETGRVVFAKEVDLSSIQHVIFMSYASETLVVTGSKYATVDAEETKGRSKPTQLKRVRYDLFGFDATTGALRWKTTQTPNYDDVLTGDHGEQVQHPSIVGDVVYGPDFALHLASGQPYEGWKWRKSEKCATLSTSRYCAFSRFTEKENPKLLPKLPFIFDLKTGKKEPLMVATRPGCWINTLPAGGMVIIPDATAGCTCPYPMQASVVLMPRD